MFLTLIFAGALICSIDVNRTQVTIERMHNQSLDYFDSSFWREHLMDQSVLIAVSDTTPADATLDRHSSQTQLAQMKARGLVAGRLDASMHRSTLLSFYPANIISLYARWIMQTKIVIFIKNNLATFKRAPTILQSLIQLYLLSRLNNFHSNVSHTLIHLWYHSNYIWIHETNYSYSFIVNSHFLISFFNIERILLQIQLLWI